MSDQLKTLLRRTGTLARSAAVALPAAGAMMFLPVAAQAATTDSTQASSTFSAATPVSASQAAVPSSQATTASQAQAIAKIIQDWFPVH